MSRERAATLVGLGLVLVVSAAALGFYGLGIPGAEIWLRWTARTSFAIFVVAFVAPFLERRSAALRRVALPLLAVSHTLHLGSIVWMARLTDGANVAERANVVLLGSGVIAYSVIYYLALRPEHRLADLGLVWLWVVFSGAYLPRVRADPATFGVVGALLVVSLILRLPDLYRRARTRPVIP